MASQDDLDYELAQEYADLHHSRKDPSPSQRQKIGSFTIACLILNRTIGSGIFVAPRLVFLGTNSTGISIILWLLGGVIMFCGLVVWTEFGLTIPQRLVPGGRQAPVPRSGGEKNYLEYLLQRPKFLATCMYGVAFMVLGNLSGNAVAFATYVLAAAGIDDAPRNWNIAIAVGISTVSCMIHLFSRRGGILLSNFLAILKVVILLAVIIVGLAVGAGAKIGVGSSQSADLQPQKAFVGRVSSISDYATSLFYVIYTYSGFEQPFYVLGEAKHPRKTFPRTTFWTMIFTIVLFVLVNVAYACATPTDVDFLRSGSDMATLFFEHIFGSKLATRVTSGVISFCIAGNIIVMTFTAARVKQEIAKEGILPFSLFFATGRVTPDAWLRAKFSGQQRPVSSGKDEASRAADELLFPERTPVGALILHWVLSIVLIEATSTLTAGVAYTALVFLYSYVIIAMTGFCVALGLVCLYLTPSAKWQQQGGPQGFRPRGGPTAAIIYAVASLFVIITVFLRPSDDSPFSYRYTGITWYILPAIGLSAPLWGLAWWLGLHFVMQRRGLQLMVTRVPHIELDSSDGSRAAEWVQRSEVIVREWTSRQYTQSFLVDGNRSDLEVGKRTVFQRVREASPADEPGYEYPPRSRL